MLARQHRKHGRWRLYLALMLAVPTLSAHAASTPGKNGDATAERLLNDARAQQAAGQRMHALALCEDALARRPGYPDALRLQIQLLSEMGAAAQAQAQALAKQLHPAMSDADQAKLQADLGAHQTRWSRAVPADPRHPYAEADHAVATLDQVVSAHAGEASLRARIDRLIAYDQAERAAEAVQDYNAMRRSERPLHEQPLPPYAEASVADALLKQHQPERAIPLYEDSIRRTEGPYPEEEDDPRIGLMYAYMESGRYHDAQLLIDRAATAEPVWLARHGTMQLQPSSHKTEADLHAALWRRYMWLLRDADQRISALAAQAPLDSMLRREQGNTQRARGWPRQSEDTLVTTLGIDPNDTQARLGIIDDWRELNDFPRVETALREVETVEPRDPLTHQTRHDWDHQRDWQFDITYDRGWGNTPTYGDDDHETEATLQSPLLADHWRIYGITRLAGADLQDSTAERQRAGMGVRFYERGLEAYVQVLPGISSQTRRTALEAGLKWAATDHWLFSTDWSTVGDTDTPLEASAAGITAHALDASAEWRASELTSVKLTAARDLFSDGDHRDGWEAALVQRLYTAPYLTLDGGATVGSTHNTLTNVPYYSPQWARWAMFTSRLESMLYQRYENEWRQRIDVSFGTYQEYRYGSGWIAEVRYGQTFQPHNGLSFGWGLGWSNQPYDGKRESRVMLDLTMHWGE